MLKLMRDNLKNLKWILWFVVFIFVLLIFVDWGAGRGRGRGMEGLAAKVGGVAITEAQFLRELRSTEERYRQQYGEQWEQLRQQVDLAAMTLQNMIDREILLRHAARMGFRVEDEELLKRIVSFPGLQREDGSFVGEERYTQILRANQTTPEAFEEALRRDMLLEKLEQALLGGIVIPDAEVEREYRRRNEKASFDVLFVGSNMAMNRVTASEAEARAYYDSHQDEFTHGEQRRLLYLLVDNLKLRRTLTVPESQIVEYYTTHQNEFQTSEEVRARHILIRPATQDEQGWRDAQTRLREVAQRAMAPGADFAALARQYSEDEGSKASGGDLGWFGRGRMVKEFEDAVFALQVGQVSGPVKSQFGYHLIKLEERRPAGVEPLEQVRDRVRDRVAEGLADAEGSRRAAALREKIEAAKLSTDEQWRSLADDVVTSNVTPYFAAGEPIPGVGRDPELLAEVAAAKEGAVGGPRRTPRGWIVYRVSQIRKAGTTPFEEAKQEAEEGAKRQKAVALLRQELEGRRANLMSAPFSTVAPLVGGTANTVTDHTRGSAIPGVGVAQALEEAVFATPIGGLTPVVAVGDRGVAVAKVTAKTVFNAQEFARDKETVRKSLVQAELDRLLAALLAEAKREDPPTVNQELLNRFKNRAG
jgi:peptidyl-prolyl cis-trans isomerase D